VIFMFQNITFSFTPTLKLDREYLEGAFYQTSNLTMHSF